MENKLNDQKEEEMIIEEKYGLQMKDFIILSYANGTPGAGAEEFHKNIGKTARQMYLVWKKLEESLFLEGKIPFIAVPYHAA